MSGVIDSNTSRNYSKISLWDTHGTGLKCPTLRGVPLSEVAIITEFKTLFPNELQRGRYRFLKLILLKTA